MAQHTPNYGLEMPEATEDFKDFRESYNSNMEIIDLNMGGGGGSGGHTIYDEAGNALPQESGMQFTGAVSVSDDSGNGRTVVNIESGGSTFGFAIDENNKLFEGTINNFNQSLSYTATEDGIALCWYKGSVGTWQFLLVNGVMLRLGGDGTNTPVSYSIPIRKGDTVSARYQSGSESCYFWLSVYGIKQGTNGIFAPVIYSDTERKIGIWRDNKPLYQRTFVLPSPLDISSSSWTGTGQYISNGENIIFCQATANDGTTTPLMAYFNSGEISCQTPRNGTSWSIQFLTLQYTKTTDTPGSGTWTTSGAAAVHYSTNEQVIGTWIDGKPLYEKVVVISSGISAGGDVQIAHNIADIDTICKYTGYGRVGNSAYENHSDNNYYLELHEVSRSATFWKIGNNIRSQISSLIVILQYTKTTD